MPPLIKSLQSSGKGNVQLPLPDSVNNLRHGKKNHADTSYDVPWKQPQNQREVAEIRPVGKIYFVAG